jgi:hypothetical protein
MGLAANAAAALGALLLLHCTYAVAQCEQGRRARGPPIGRARSQPSSAGRRSHGCGRQRARSSAPAARAALTPAAPTPAAPAPPPPAPRAADRDMLKLTQQEFESLPLQLGLEVLAGAALALAGGYGLAGRLKAIVVETGL